MYSMASSSLAPGKITLHSTCKIPLSERFKLVQQTAIIKKNIEPVSKAPQVSVKPLARGSLKNRQLAAAFASKPSIRAALAIKRKSIKQRLSVKSKASRGTVSTLVNRSSVRAKRNAKKSIIERLQIAPSTSGNSKRPKLNRNNFVGTTKSAFRNLRQTAKQGGKPSFNIKPADRRPGLNRSNNNNRVNNNFNKNNNQSNRPVRQGNANVATRRNQQRFNQQMKNRRINTNNKPFKGDQQRQPQRQRQFNRRNNQQNRPGQQGQQGQQRARGGNNQNRNNRRFQNKRSNNRQNQRRNTDKNSLDKDLDAYMAKTRNQLDADLNAYMSST